MCPTILGSYPGPLLLPHSWFMPCQGPSALEWDPEAPWQFRWCHAQDPSHRHTRGTLSSMAIIDLMSPHPLCHVATHSGRIQGENQTTSTHSRKLSAEPMLGDHRPVARGLWAFLAFLAPKRKTVAAIISHGHWGTL